MPVGIGDGDIGEIAGTTVFDHYLPGSVVASIAIILIFEDTITIAVDGLLNANLGADDQVGGNVPVRDGAAQGISSRDGGIVGGIYINCGFVVEFYRGCTSTQVEWKTKVMPVGIGDGDIGEIAGTTVFDHYLPGSVVASIAIILIFEDTITIAVDGLLNANLGADDQVGGNVPVRDGAAQGISSRDGGIVGGIYINCGFVVEFYRGCTDTQVEGRTKVMPVAIGDGDIGEVTVTTVFDHYLPGSVVASIAIILIFEDTITIAVDGLLNANLGADDQVGGNVPVRDGAAQGISSRDGGIVGGIYINCGFVVEFYRGCTSRQVEWKTKVMPVAIGDGDIGEIAGTTVFDHYLPGSVVASIAIILIFEDTITIAVDGLLNANLGADDQVGGNVPVRDGAAQGISSRDGGVVGGIYINCGFVVEFYRGRTDTQVEGRTKVMPVAIGDGDIGEVTVTTVFDHYLPGSVVASIAIILIFEDTITIAVDGLLNANLGADDQVGGNVPVRDGAAQGISSRDGGIVGGIYINCGFVVEFYRGCTDTQVEGRTKVMPVGIGDGDIGEIAGTTVFDHYLPGSVVASIAIILIFEDTITIAVDGLLNANLGADDQVGGNVPVRDGAAQGISSRDGGIVGGIYINCGFVVEFYRGAPTLRLKAGPKLCPLLSVTVTLVRSLYHSF